MMRFRCGRTHAASAAGLAVEFRNLENVFTGDETGILRKPTSVRYRREVGVTFDPQSHDSMFFAKFEDWSYEQEVRVVLPLSDCKMETVSRKQLYLFEVPRSCVARVISAGTWLQRTSFDSAARRKPQP